MSSSGKLARVLGRLTKPFRSARPGASLADIRFEGEFQTWSDAQRASTGYSAQEILRRTLHAALKVRKGEAAYERDSVLFPEIEYSFPLLAALLLAALTEKRLSVLDFGGALGSSYFQNRSLLQGIQDLKWGVVEQEDFVICGREHIAHGPLFFFSTVEDCFRANRPNFVLLSSVLSYLPNPIAFLRELIGFAPSFICLDRTLVAVQGETRLTVQVVPPHIYKASYPCWIVKEGELLAPFKDAYRRAYAFQALGSGTSLDGITGAFRGYLFVRADVASAVGVG